MNKYLSVFLLIFVSIYSIHTNAMMRIVDKGYKQDSYCAKHNDSRKIIVRRVEKEAHIKPIKHQGLSIESCLCAVLQQNILTIPSLCCTYSCLKDAAVAANTLAQINKFLNTFTNDANNTLCLIKELSRKFNCSNETVAQELCTKKANERFAIQYALIGDWAAYAFNTFEKRIKKAAQVADINFTYGPDKKTPLILASQYNISTSADIVSLLMQRGADITAYTTNRENAFMFALKSFNRRVINLFLAHPLMSKIFLNQRDCSGQTALHYSIHGLWHNGHRYHQGPDERTSFMYQIIEQLLEKRINPNTVDKHGRTASMLAVEWGDPLIIQLLQDAEKNWKN